MNLLKNKYLIIFFVLLLSSCRKDEPSTGKLQIFSVTAGSKTLYATQTIENIPLTASFSIEFTRAVDTASARKNISLLAVAENKTIACNYGSQNENRIITIAPIETLEATTSYKIVISSELRGAAKEKFPGAEFQFITEQGMVLITSIKINGKNFATGATQRDIPYNNATVEISFSEKLDESSLTGKFNTFPISGFTTSLSGDQKVVTINFNQLDYYYRYMFFVSSSLVAANGYTFSGFSNTFYTGLNPTPKFQQISDEELMTLVQQQTFRYFWDFAHPVSGLARERNTSGETVTIGGSGFGLMAILVGVERGFITRNDGVARLNKIVDFLALADRFHGVWPHWLNGTTGATIAFSTKDNGGDLVETSFMAAGLLTVRQYLDNADPFESGLISKINTLLDGIEWSWYTRGGQNVLYWHWSPNFGWDMNMQVRGYNEALITYFMAAASTTYSVEAQVYHQGWANSGGIINGKSFYGVQLPLGYDYGGPLFFAHYSFLGLNPMNLSDQYANYWDQNRNHSLINRQHCIVNPFNRTGYSADCWGLTASDDPAGYRVHEPTSSRDNGTISPTAALSSMPFTPQESIQAMRHFYFTLGDKLWGQYGFYDAFNPSQGWWANSYLAIDQGPIIIMIENHRSGLIWNLFMSAPEVQLAMQKLGFSN